MSFVYVIVAYQSDLSGFKLIGVYDQVESAEDLLRIAAAVGSDLIVKAFRLPVGESQPIDVVNDPGLKLAPQ